MDFLSIFIFILTLSAFFSIVSLTPFEEIILLALIFYLYYIIRKREKPSGTLLFPLLLSTAPTIISTALYAPQHLSIAIEMLLFMFIYPIGAYVKPSSSFYYRMNLFLISMGFILMPVALYKYYETGMIASIWGEVFRVAIFYSIFSLSALALFLQKRNPFYLFAFFIFISLVFFSARRATLIGFLITLLIFIFLVRRIIKVKYLLVGFLSFSLIAGFFSYYLIKNDARFGTLYKVITGKEAISDKTLNDISSKRWAILKAGVEVIKKDVSEERWINLLIGHGLAPGYRLEPPSPVIANYESIIFISELIERGVLGLLGMLFVFFRYYSFVIRFPLDKSPLLTPFLLTLSVHLIGSIFSYFWNALLPLYLVWFRLAEEEGKRLSQK